MSAFELSDRELRRRLVNLGAAPGPITATTRSLYVQQLSQIQNNRPPLRRTPSPPKQRQSSQRSKWRQSSTTGSSVISPSLVETNGVDVRRTSPRRSRDEPLRVAREGSAVWRQSRRAHASISDLSCEDVATPPRDDPHRQRVVFPPQRRAISGASWSSATSAPRLSRQLVSDTATRQVTGSWRSRIVPLMLLLVVALFFGFVLRAYLQLQQPSDDTRLAGETQPPDASTTDSQQSGQDVFPICMSASVDLARGCVTADRIETAVELLAVVHDALLAHAKDVACGHVTPSYPGSESPHGSDHQLSVQELANRLNGNLRYSTSLFTIESRLRDLAVVVAYNVHWGVATDVGIDRESSGAPVHLWLAEFSAPWRCVVVMLMWRLLRWVMTAAAVLSAAWASLRLLQLYRRHREQQQRELFDLVEKIVQMVSEMSETGDGNGRSHPVTITHVRDQLIPLRQRDSRQYQRLWCRAVEFLRSNESRLRTELMTISGEQFAVWRWLPAAHKVGSCQRRAGRRRVWVGRAFATADGFNMPQRAPSQCLKIRNMFDPSEVAQGNAGDEGWRQEVIDALLDKCHTACIVHLCVDTRSKDGLVYAKCASAADALTAFRCVQACWFDGRIVSVKFITLERYHERFPDSRHNVVALCASNNWRSSMSHVEKAETEPDEDD